MKPYRSDKRRDKLPMETLHVVGAGIDHTGWNHDPRAGGSPVEEPPNEPKKPPVEEPGERPGKPPVPKKPPVEEPGDTPLRPPVKEPPPRDPNRP